MKIAKHLLYQTYIIQKNNIPKTAKLLKISRNSVKNLLNKYNIPIKSSGAQKKYYAIDNFFKKWSSDMAYCLGFISADGHIWKNRPFITIGLSSKDDYILTYIRDCISPTSRIRYSKNHVQINIHSVEIHKDLVKFGVNNGKTFNLDINFNIPTKYWGDYLRGVFDGDGSIWSIKHGKEYYYANIVSASKNFLEKIKYKLGFGLLRIVRNKYFELRFNQSDCIKLFKIMYKDPNCFKLLRKYNRFLAINKNYFYWTIEEDIYLINNYNNKNTLTKKLSNRTWLAIQARKRKLKNEGRINCEL